MNRLFLAAILSALVLGAQPQMPPPEMGAQPPAAGQPQDDPPSRVARLNWFSGDVAFQPATVDTWTNATPNYPLTTGDHLFVNAGARAELHIDGSALRLNANSNFGFLNLNDTVVQMSLNQGSLELRLRQLDQNDTFEIDTPNGAVTLLRAGEYRVDADPVRNATMVTVRSGQAQMFQEGNSLLITPHQSVWFREGGGPEVLPESVRDDFDAFVSARDAAEDGLPRRDYVPQTMVGYQDLYAYGHWVLDPVYGEVWVPPVTPGWAPYTTGRWAYVQPWGWTWIDDAPWGFAPFHYGRWAMLRGIGWAWIPGASAYRPVYAPALVGFVGGGGFGVSIGWFPLGPREPWIPAWGASAVYVSNVNIMHVNVNVVSVTNINYVNRQSVTVVSQADFAGSRPVGAAMVRMSPAQIQGAQVLGSNPQVVPARTSVAIGAARVAPAVSARPVVARSPLPPAPVSFAAQQQLLTQSHGVPLRASQVAQLRAQQPAAVVARPAVRSIGAPAATTPSSAASPATAVRPIDRMSSRPPGAQPLPAANPAAQAQPASAAPRPASAPSAVRPTTQPTAPVPGQRSAPAKPTKAAPKGKPEENKK